MNGAWSIGKRFSAVAAALFLCTAPSAGQTIDPVEIIQALAACNQSLPDVALEELGWHRLETPDPSFVSLATDGRTHVRLHSDPLACGASRAQETNDFLALFEDSTFVHDAGFFAFSSSDEIVMTHVVHRVGFDASLSDYSCVIVSDQEIFGPAMDVNGNLSRQGQLPDGTLLSNWFYLWPIEGEDLQLRVTVWPAFAEDETSENCTPPLMAEEVIIGRFRRIL